MMQMIAAAEGVMGRWGAGAALKSWAIALAHTAPSTSSQGAAQPAPAACAAPNTASPSTATTLPRSHNLDTAATASHPMSHPWQLATSHATPPPPSNLHARSFTTSPLLHKEMRFPMPRRTRDAAAATKPAPTPKPPSPLPSPTLPPLEPIDPFNTAQQTQLTLHGRPLTGDPGSTRWGAPYYIPPALQKGVLPVLLADPWPAARDPELRRSHAKLLVDLLREQAPKRMSGAEIIEQVHALHGPTFGSLGYVRKLLEHLRSARMIRGANNPAEQTIGPGARDYPLLYYAEKHQQEEYGAPLIVARRKQAEREAAVAHAMKRLRRRKAPYPIHRRRAFESALHYELGQAQVRAALAEQQEHRQLEEWKTSLNV